MMLLDFRSLTTEPKELDYPTGYLISQTARKTNHQRKYTISE